MLHVSAAGTVTIHAVLGRREVPAVIGWVGLAWLAPFVGSLMYLAFGVNRIRRNAAMLWSEGSAIRIEQGEHGGTQLPALLLEASPALDELARVGAAITGLPLRAGNRIEPLVDGDEAYPAMLEAINHAQRSLMLATYIFDHDRVGIAFRDALVAAKERGVAVRVLVDGVGARYSRPTMPASLKALGIPSAMFLSTGFPFMLRYANLRNHRKLLVVDGRIGFTGGMNIREGHQLSLAPASPVRCLHFRVSGPIVGDLARVFMQDWAFTTGEMLPASDDWCPVIPADGEVVARGVSDGPDGDLENLPEIILGALSAARRRVSIVTPYFLPDARIISALRIAALRGLSVDIVIPGRSNVPIMDWATTPQLVPLVQSGCRIWRSPPPFDHTKLFVIDGVWSLIGSTNWDARSLRLNFEHNLECYDRALAERLEAIVEGRIAAARAVMLDALRARSFVVRVRDGVARLFSPYL